MFILLAISSMPNSASAINAAVFSCSLENVSIQYDNIPNQLSTASKQILYEISRENGCKMTYPEWAGLSVNTEGTGLLGTVGSVFCARFGTNIICNGTPSDVYPTNLQIQSKP